LTDSLGGYIDTIVIEQGIVEIDAT
jgi:hypothetical protein